MKISFDLVRTKGRYQLIKPTRERGDLYNQFLLGNNHIKQFKHSFQQ